VVGQDPVVENLVAVVELVEEDVLVHVLLEVAQLAVGVGGLLVEGFDGGGEAADESEPTPLLLGESGAAIGQGIGDDGRFGRHVVSSDCVEVLGWAGPLGGVEQTRASGSFLECTASDSLEGCCGRTLVRCGHDRHRQVS